MAASRIATRPQLVLALVLASVVAACGSNAEPAPSEVAVVASPTPVTAPAPTRTPRPSPSPTARPTPTPTLEPEPDPTPAPTLKPLPSALHGKVTLDELGLTLTLPKGWETIGLDGEAVQAIFDAVPDGVLAPNVADQIPAMVAAGLRLWAFDLRARHVGASVNILSVERIPPSLLPLSARLGLAYLKGATITGTKELTIDGQPCLRVDLTVATQVRGRTLTMVETQLYLTRPHSTVVLTIAIPKGGAMVDRDSIVKSVHLHE